MAEIINLRLARKARGRAAAEAEAAANRVKFGQSRQAKQASRAETLRVEKTLDGAKRED